MKLLSVVSKERPEMMVTKRSKPPTHNHTSKYMGPGLHIHIIDYNKVHTAGFGLPPTIIIIIGPVRSQAGWEDDSSHHIYTYHKCVGCLKISCGYTRL